MPILAVKPTVDELMAQIGEKDARIVALEEQVSETKKESQYKISSLAQEMKAQEDRLRRENEKTKVNHTNGAPKN